MAGIKTRLGRNIQALFAHALLPVLLEEFLHTLFDHYV